MTISANNVNAKITPKIIPKIPIILASKSFIRQKMLVATGLEFTAKPADIDERSLQKTIQDNSVEEHVRQLANAKAKVISDEYGDSIVIGADQIGIIDDDMLFKPKTEAKAIEQLSCLSGKTHHQYNATCFYHQGELIWSQVGVAALTMRNLSESEIVAYVAMDNPIGCCGAYKFESLGCHLFNDVEGQADVIQGLSLLPLLNALQDYGVYKLEKL